MKELNNIQSKKILKYIEENKMSLDEIQQHFLDVMMINGMTNNEVAALLFSIMRNVLATESNKKALNAMGINNVNQLGVTGVLEVQKLMIDGYNKESKQGNSLKKKTNKSIKKRVKK